MTFIQFQQENIRNNDKKIDHTNIHLIKKDIFER